MQQTKRRQTKKEGESNAAGKKFTFNIKKNPQVKAGNEEIERLQ